MAYKYIIRKRTNTILYAEFLIAAIAAGTLPVIYYKVQLGIGLAIGVLSAFFFTFLFFANRIFRYIFSILFSIGWAFLAFLAGGLTDKNAGTTGYIFAIVAFVISLWAHRNHFDFIKKAKVYEYEEL